VQQDAWFGSPSSRSVRPTGSNASRQLIGTQWSESPA
jgi:hypothetical protein